MAKRIPLNYASKSLPLQLMFVVAVLSFCHIIVMIIHYEIISLPGLFRDLFDLDEEQSFGTWFSAVILLFSGRLLHLQARDPELADSNWRFAWRVLGLGFFFLSLDEVVGLHETLNTITDFSWTIPGTIVAGIVGLIYIPFLRHLPPRSRWLFILSGAIYLGGAVGVEHATNWYEDEGLLDTLEYNLTTVLEEAMEMGGVVLFIYALLSHIAEGKDDSVDVDVEVS